MDLYRLLGGSGLRKLFAPVERNPGFGRQYVVMKLLLWDIDLTLIKSGGAGIHALNRAFEGVYGWKNALNGVTPQGKTDPAIIREVCVNHGVSEDADVRWAVGSILDCYVGYLDHAVKTAESYQVLPGIIAVLDAFRGRDDIVLGLATGNIEAAARIKLERGNLNAYFPFGGFGQISENRVDVVREASRQARQWTGLGIAPDQTFVIGDTPHDVQAGREAGFQTVAVATGSSSVEQLRATGADLVIEDFASGRDQFMRSTRIV
jgi:phosphoglycolate phosphatase-like HAD superfamily hydrolase